MTKGGGLKVRHLVIVNSWVSFSIGSGVGCVVKLCQGDRDGLMRRYHLVRVMEGHSFVRGIGVWLKWGEMLWDTCLFRDCNE